MAPTPPRPSRPAPSARTPEEIARIAAIANRNATVRAVAKIGQAAAIAVIVFGLFVAAIEYSRLRGACAAPATAQP